MSVFQKTVIVFCALMFAASASLFAAPRMSRYGENQCVERAQKLLQLPEPRLSLSWRSRATHKAMQAYNDSDSDSEFRLGLALCRGFGVDPLSSGCERGVFQSETIERQNDKSRGNFELNYEATLDLQSICRWVRPETLSGNYFMTVFVYESDSMNPDQTVYEQAVDVPLKQLVGLMNRPIKDWNYRFDDGKLAMEVMLAPIISLR